MAKTNNKGKIILLAILLLATLLRLYKINEVPVSLFGDEIDAGYHAYSILKTGRDYQGNFMPIHFHSLAEWRTPLFIYSLVPAIAIFGVTPWGVRIPSALFGVIGIWGFYLLVKEMLSYKNVPVNKHPRALLSAFLLALSPWHIQYSRAGFEVTMLLSFLIFGLYFFFKALNSKGNHLWFSVALLTFTPWIYSTAKLFTPILFIFIFFTWKKEILKFTTSNQIKGILTGLIVGTPIIFSTVFGGGAQRASFTSVFTDPMIETKIGGARTLETKVLRGQGIAPSIIGKAFHNKFTFWGESISENFLRAYSTDFLFIKGDPNLRHSPNGVGQFFKIEFLGLILGMVWFFNSNTDLKMKLLVCFWLILGTLPSALTRDGGNHATRLILILPPLVFLISYGIIESIRKIDFNLKYIFTILYFGLYTLSFIFYIHNYYVHYPLDSDRWWHYGFKQSFDAMKSRENDFDKVVISMSGEPAWIFFAGLTPFDPGKWQKEFPINNKVDLDGFGEVSHIDKYYFASVPEKVGIYGLPQIIDEKTLYLSVAKEIGANLIKEPGRVPPGLDLLRAVSYPSGEPAFYIFSKKR